MIFALTDSLAYLYLAAALFGAGASAITTLGPAVVGDTFGSKHVGANAGFILGIAGGAAAIGPFFAGLIKDATGDYQAAFLIAASFNVAAIVLLALLRLPQRK